MLAKRYSTFDEGNGKLFEKGELNLVDLFKIAYETEKYSLKSGKQELIENIIFNNIN
jgi:xylose isomerase